MKGKKECPACKELVHKKATKCPHCQSRIGSGSGCLATLLFLIVLIGYFWGFPMLGTGDATRRDTSPQSTSRTPASRRVRVSAPREGSERFTERRASIPRDVSYTIIDSHTVRGIKRSLDVRLNKKVSESVLRAIALKLKSQDSRTYERTFIGYLLPGMKVNAGAWATTHFNPSLEVEILGMTLEDEELLRDEQPREVSRDVIASGLDDSPFAINQKVTIYREGKRFFMEGWYKGDTLPPKRLFKTDFKLGTRYKYKSAFGEYYLLDSRGNLEIWDRDGFIVALRRVD